MKQSLGRRNSRARRRAIRPSPGRFRNRNFLGLTASPRPECGFVCRALLRPSAPAVARPARELGPILAVAHGLCGEIAFRARSNTRSKRTKLKIKSLEHVLTGKPASHLSGTCSSEFPAPTNRSCDKRSSQIKSLERILIAAVCQPLRNSLSRERGPGGPKREPRRG